MNYCIVQARIDSKRFPGKSMAMIQGKPSLGHILDRIKNSEYTDKIIVATGRKDYNWKIIRYCIENDIEWYSGPEDNVLERYCNLIKEKNINPDDNIIRITGDCPLICAEIIDEMLLLIGDDIYIGNQEWCLEGTDVEIIKTKILLESLEKYKYDEHVTFRWKRDNIDKLKQYKYGEKKLNHIHYSLDTIDDYIRILRLYHRFKEYQYFGYNEIVSVIGK